VGSCTSCSDHEAQNSEADHPYQGEAIELVIRYGMTTANLAHVFLRSAATEDATRKLLNLLWGKGWLRRFEPLKKFRYFVLSPQATAATGLHRRLSRELG
jgi:hypothetical protein